MAPKQKPETPAPRKRQTQTRQRLIEAGLALLAEWPIDALTIDMIVERADAGKGSFYNHFVDRAAFAEAVAAHVREAIEARIFGANVTVSDPAERMIRAMCVNLNFALTHPDHAAIMAKSHAPATRASHALNRGLKQDLETGLASGRFYAATADSAALFVLGVNYITLLRLVSERAGVRSARAVARQSGLHLLLGLGLSRRDAQQLAGAAADTLITGRDQAAQTQPGDRD
jgi:AcrR family transcriptional regulator